MNPASPFLSACQENPDRLAIVELNGQQITGGELLHRVYGLAEHLRSLGVSKGDRVLVQVPPGIDLSITMLAVLWVGGVVVLLESGVGDQIYSERVQQIAPKWLLIHNKLQWVHRLWGMRWLLANFDIDVPPIPDVEQMQIITLTNRELSLSTQDSTPTSVTDTDDVIIVFTGGTTSAPKCVRYSCAALEGFLAHIHLAIGDRPIERFLADTPPQVLYAIQMGYTAYVNKGRKLKRALSMLKLIETGTIDACFTSPYLWMELIKANKVSSLPDSLHTIMLGSAPVTPRFLQQLKDCTSTNTQILCIYGMTEVGVITVVEATDKIAWRGEGDLVGKPISTITVELNTSDHTSDVGEIVVHSPSLYTGYLGREPRQLDQGLATGDLGRWEMINDQKMLVLAGRIKDMIIRNGFNIYPQTFETQLTTTLNQEQQIVHQSALVGVWNPQREDEDVVLFVEWTSSDRPSLDWLHKKATLVCGHQVAPDHIFGLEQFPVTGRQNKLDKKALRIYAEQQLGRDEG